LVVDLLVEVADSLQFFISAYKVKATMRRKKVNKILTALLLLLLVVVISIFYISFRQNEKVRANAQTVAHTAEVIKISTEVELAAYDFVLASRDYANQPTPELKSGLKENQLMLTGYTNQLRHLEEGDMQQPVMIDSMRSHVARLVQIAGTIDSIQQFKAIPLRDQSLKEVKTSMRNVLGQINLDSERLKELEYKERDQRRTEGENFLYWSKLTLYAVLIVVLILTVLIIYRIRTEFSRQSASEQKFITLLEATPDATIISDAHGIITLANRQAEKLFGYTVTELVGMKVEKLIPQQFRGGHAEKRMEFFGQSKERGMGHGAEMIALRKDGVEVPVEISLSPIQTSEGKLVAAAIRDITARKKAEDELRQLYIQVNLANEALEDKVQVRTLEIGQSEKQYRYLFENNPMPMWVFDLEDFRFLDVNEMALQKYGYTREEFLEMTLEDIRPESDKERFRHFDHAWKMNTQDTNRGVWRHCKKNGDIMDVEVIAHSILFQNKKARLVLLNDVTNRLKTERELVASEKKFRALIENSNDIIALVDADRNITYRSPSAIRITGWTDEELKKLNFLDEIVHPDDREKLKEVFHHAIQHPGVPVVVAYRSLHKNGHYIDVEGVLIDLLHRDYIHSLVFNMRDVTEKKKAEQLLVARELRFRSLIEHSADIINLMDENFQLIYRSPSARRIGGFEDDEVFGTDIRHRLHPDDHQGVQSKMNFLISNPGKSVDVLVRYMIKSGNYIWLEGTATNLLKEPSVNAIVFNYRDVTPRVEAEERLVSREKHFRSLIENSMDVIVVLDESLTMVYRSPSAFKVTGLTDDITIGRDGRKYIHPEDLGSVTILLNELVRFPGKSMNLLFRYQCGDGRYIWTEGSGTNLLLEDNIKGLVFNLRDVTERILNEEKIRINEERYRETLDNMIEGVQIIGFDWKYKYVNTSVALQSHTTKDQLIGATMMECFPGIEQSDVYRLINRCFTDRIPIQMENRFVLPDGEVLWAQLSIQPVPEGVFILSVDITEKVKAAAALKEEKHKLAAIAASSPGLIYSFQLKPDGSMSFPYASNAMEEMFGYGHELINKDVSSLLTYTVKEDQELFVERMRYSAFNLTPWNLEFRFHHPVKGLIWIEGNSIPKKEPDGTITWHGVLMDVTERKRIQEKINEQAAQLRTLSDNLPGVMIYQMVGTSFNERRFTYVSNEVTRLTGKTPEEIIADPYLLYNCILPEDVPLVSLAEERSFEQRTVFNEEVRLRTFDGEVKWLNIISSPRQTEQGEYVWDGFHVDITERKNAENAIRESEERYRTLVEQAFDGILFYDNNGRILDCNNSGANTMGYSREEMMQMNLADLFYPEDLELHPLNIPDVASGQQVFDFRTMRKKDGTPVEVEWVTRLLPDGRMLGVGRDITNQMKALSQQNLLSAIVNSSDDAIISTNLNSIISSWNLGAEQIYGYSAEEMKGCTVDMLIPPDIINNEPDIMAKIKAGDTVIHYETTHLRKDGSLIFVSITTSPLLDSKGAITGSSRIVRDITRQKEDADRIRQSNERYEAVAKATSDAIWDFDYHTNKTFIAGTGYRDLFGYELVNEFSPPRFWEERIHPEDIERVLEAMEMAKKNTSVSQASQEYRFRRADGSWAYLNDRYFILRDAAGKPLRLLGAKQDITKREEAEQEMIRIAAEKQMLFERLSVILNTLPASVALLDPKGVMVEVNDAWKQFADVNGFSGVNYGVGTSYFTISTQSFGDNEQIGKDISAGVQEVLNGTKQQFEYEYSWHLTKLNRWFRIVVTPLKGHEFNGVVVMHIDISEIRRLELERIESKIEEQKKVTEAMLKGQEKERNAIGIELHDNVNQILVGTKVLLSVVRDFPEKTSELIPSCIDNISLAVQENRKIAHELVTPNLSDENLVKQITRLSDSMLKNAGIETYINAESLNEQLLSDEMKLALYRVAQEQCTNIIKYAGAEQVIISLATKRDNFFMRIADDGHGTDPKKVTHGIGLKNISSRLSVFSGTISIDTAPDQGFALEIEIPLKQVKTPEIPA
jgi:PAS domain S-box-containing protein